ncbi:hypothetical protein ACFQ60_20355 [Streptomyces zhihengii]
MRPKKYLGRLGLVKRITPALEPSRASRLVGVEEIVHHVCLMRPAELVVTYHPGPKPPSVHQGYAGVFRADETMDEVYAKAEPPTHDAWHPQSLDRPESTYVQTTFRRIGEELNGLLSLSGTAREGSTDVALGAASSFFAGLVGGTWGTGGATEYSKPGSTTGRSRGAGAGRNGRGGSGRGGAANGSGLSEDGVELGSQDEHSAAPARTRRPRVQYVGEPYYDDRGSLSVLVQEFVLPVSGPQRVRIDLAVTLPGAGGRETDPPIGADMPELVGWEDESGRLHREEALVVVGGDMLWRAVVRPAPDTMTEIGVKVEVVRSA